MNNVSLMTRYGTAMGYRGASDTGSPEERQVLRDLVENVGFDLMGEQLTKRYNEIVAATDVGMFYCPYIPLMTTSTIRTGDEL